MHLGDLETGIFQNGAGLFAALLVDTRAGDFLEETEKEALEEYEQYDRERRICVYFLASSDIREKEEEVLAASITHR